MKVAVSNHPSSSFRPRPSGFGIGWVLVVINLLIMLSMAGFAWYLHARSVTRSVRHTEALHAMAQAAYALSIVMSDVDGDGTVEAPAEDTTGSNLPTGGGNIPSTSAAPQQDSYSTRFGYCSWDNGTTNTSANRITGDNPATDSSVVFALISAGPDRIFQTSCANARTGTVAGDDIVSYYTVAQLRKGLAGTKFYGTPVPDNATLNAVPSGGLQNGETRLVTGTNSLMRWDSSANAWDTLGSSAASTSTPITGFKNQLINGDFSIWQRGTSFSYSSQAGCTHCWTADHWRISWANTATYSLSVSQQQGDGSNSYPTGMNYYLRVNPTAISGTGTTLTLDQPIENVAALSGDTVTVSFYGRASDNTTIGLQLVQKFGTGGSANVIIFNAVSNTMTCSYNYWCKGTQTFNIPSIAGQTLGTDSNLDLQMTWTPIAGSTMDFGMVQVEAGSTATTLEYRPPGVELALADRYYQASGTDSSDTTWADYAPASSTIDRSVLFPVPMRTPPNTIALTQNSTAQWSTCATGVYACLRSSSSNGFTYTLTANATSEIKTSDLRWTADAEFNN